METPGKPILHVYLKGFPMPPSANRIFSSRGGRITSSKTARAYREAVGHWNLANVQKTIAARREIKEFVDRDPAIKLQIDATFYFHTRRILTKAGIVKRNDTSNYLKALQDSVAHILVIDDRLFWRGSYDKIGIANAMPQWVDIRILEARVP